ncbi:HAD family hydrolase [Nocardia sp. BMG51109]|uniref:HAD family hydrolase n=1 Tax=Nocardia sp. BMG51109 TaxID=1056816 RepID=UPI0004676439|nr:HAD family hydrolase [Nocardia sp. BMG51109]
MTGRPTGDIALLFDRDDTLIHDVPYLSDPALVQPIPGAVTVLAAVRAAGVPTAVVSNQSGVASGAITPERLAAVVARVDALLGPFDTWQICPHGPADGCECRKPRPGLIRAAAAALGLPPARCVVIGDIGSDVHAARAAGARAILVPTARTRPAEISHARAVAQVAPDLVTAVTLARVTPAAEFLGAGKESS